MKKLMLIACFVVGGFATAQAQQTSPVWPGCEDAEDVKLVLIRNYLNT